jgi:hypothetical protein
MTKRPFINQTSQADRQATLENDQRVHKNTYLSHTHNEAGGRFAKISPLNVTGSSTLPQYPAGPNWSADPSGQEPPLGFSVEDHPPVGEAFEVERSLGEAARSDSSSFLRPDVVDEQRASPTDPAEQKSKDCLGEASTATPAADAIARDAAIAVQSLAASRSPKKKSE